MYALLSDFQSFVPFELRRATEEAAHGCRSCARLLHQRRPETMRARRTPTTYPTIYSGARRSRRALPMTDTELKLIAAAAKMGESRIPNAG